MTEAVKFTIGQHVSLLIDREKRGMVTGILFRLHGPIYLITWAENLEEKYHFDCELESAKEFAL